MFRYVFCLSNVAALFRGQLSVKLKRLTSHLYISYLKSEISPHIPDAHDALMLRVLQEALFYCSNHNQLSPKQYIPWCIILSCIMNEQMNRTYWMQ